MNGGILHRYIAKEYFISFGVAFLFFFFIFFINNMLLMAERLLVKNVSVIDAALLLIYLLPVTVSLSFPFASLVGGLMAIGRISSQNEILAIQASGVPQRQVFVPMLLIAVFLTIVSFFTNDYFLPLGTIQFQKLYREVYYSNPELELEPRSVHYYRDRVIIPGEVEGNVIKDLVIIDRDEQGGRRFIQASDAFLAANADSGDLISLRLDNVFAHAVDQKKVLDHQWIRAGAMDYNLSLSSFSQGVSSLSPAEMSSGDLYDQIAERRQRQAGKVADHERDVANQRYRVLATYDELSQSFSLSGLANVKADLQLYRNLASKDVSDRTLRIYELEYYLKFALPAGILCFVFLAFPLGLSRRRTGGSVGFGIGLLISVVYWGFLYGGKTLGARLPISPFLAVWAGNIVVLVIGGILYFRRARL
jgi:lipopolysaccharide export system permease protein